VAFPELEPWDLDESERIAVLEMIGELELAFEAEATTPEEEAGEESETDDDAEFEATDDFEFVGYELTKTEDELGPLEVVSLIVQGQSVITTVSPLVAV